MNRLPDPLIGKLQHRPEVDGLRAVAVLPVILFHAHLGMPGGFVGVDVFFVISGFLITSLIIRDLDTGSFSMVGFWERRARRIMPASLVMVIATLAAGWLLSLPVDFTKLAKSAVWQSAFLANFHFWKTTDYFAGAAEEQPLLHTWSLAVEEQFYLFVPLILWGCFRFARMRERGSLIVLMGGGLVASLVVSALMVAYKPAAAFYLLPFRAWELLCGSLVAVLPVRVLARGLREVICWLGLAMILVPCLFYTKDTPFPGVAAVPPCLGTAWFIWASRQSDAAEPLPLAARLLSMRFPVFIGLISYSLYLWHWPLFAFSASWALEPPPLMWRGSLVAASFVLAILSWRYVETPFRTRSLGTSRASMFGYAAGGLGVSSLAAVIIVLAAGFPKRFSPQVNAFDSTRDEALPKNRIVQAVPLEAALSGKLPRVGPPAPAPVRLLVWGDSHARAILPAVIAHAEERRSGVEVAWHSSTPPVLGYVPHPDHVGFSLGDDCPAFNQAVIDHVAKRGIPHVLLVARWRDYFEVRTEKGLGMAPDAFDRALIHTIRSVRAAGATPWILMEVPGHRTAVPKALVSHELFGTDLSPYTCSVSLLGQRNSRMRALVPALREAGAQVIDANAPLLDPARDICRMELDGVALYYDEHHLSRAGALLVKPALEPVFR